MYFFLLSKHLKMVCKRKKIGEKLLRIRFGLNYFFPTILDTYFKKNKKYTFQMTPRNLDDVRFQYTRSYVSLQYIVCTYM